jgi:hypothetical protein
MSSTFFNNVGQRVNNALDTKQSNLAKAQREYDAALAQLGADSPMTQALKLNLDLLKSVVQQDQQTAGHAGLFIVGGLLLLVLLARR